LPLRAGDQDGNQEYQGHDEKNQLENIPLHQPAHTWEEKKLFSKNKAFQKI
jgi:hypothetical protein